MRSHRTVVGVVAALIAGLLTVSACGSSDDSSAGDAGGSGKMTTVNVVEAAATPGRMPFYVALYGGSFEKQGLKVNLLEAQSGSQAAQLVAGGKAQFQLGQTSDALNSVLAKQPVSIVAMLNQRYSNALIVSKKYQGKVKDFSDLADVPIGITGVGSGTWQFAKLIGKLGGIPKSKLNMVNIGGAAIASGQSLTSGRVGAQVSNDPTDLRLTNSGDAFFLADPLDLDQGVSKKYPEWVKLATDPYVYNVMYATKSYVDKNADVTQRMLDALQDAENLIYRETPEKVASVLMQNDQLKPFGEDLLAQTVQRARDTSKSLPTTFAIPEGAYATTVAFASQLNKSYTSIPFSDVVNNSFADKAASTVGEAKPSSGTTQ